MKRQKEKQKDKNKQKHKKYDKSNVFQHMCDFCKKVKSQCMCYFTNNGVNKVDNVYYFKNHKKTEKDENVEKYTKRQNLFKNIALILGATACISGAIAIPNLSVNNTNNVVFHTIEDNSSTFESNHECENQDSSSEFEHHCNDDTCNNDCHNNCYNNNKVHHWKNAGVRVNEQDATKNDKTTANENYDNDDSTNDDNNNKNINNDDDKSINNNDNNSGNNDDISTIEENITKDDGQKVIYKDCRNKFNEKSKIFYRKNPYQTTIVNKRSNLRNTMSNNNSDIIEENKELLFKNTVRIVSKSKKVRNFGCCNAISKDGKWIIVGAKNEMATDKRGFIITCGAVYIYNLQQSNNNINQNKNEKNAENKKYDENKNEKEEKLEQYNEQYQWLQYGSKLQLKNFKENTCLFQGSCVAINGDGSVIAFSGQALQEDNNLINTNSNNDNRGDVILNANHMITLFVFRRDDEKKCYVQDYTCMELAYKQLNNSRISCLHLDYSGNILIFGQPYQNLGQGSVSIWFFIQDRWISIVNVSTLYIPNDLLTTTTNNTNLQYHFGYSIDISSDASTIIVGIPQINNGQGMVCMYKWVELQESENLEENLEEITTNKVQGFYNYVTSLTPDDYYNNTMINNNHNNTHNKTLALNNGNFGSSVTIDKTGDNCFIYAPNSTLGPQVYIYIKNKLQQFVIHSMLPICESFGSINSTYSIATIDDGNLLAVGYELYQNNQGVVKIYKKESSNNNNNNNHYKWNILQTISFFKDNKQALLGNCVSFNHDGSILSIGNQLNRNGRGSNFIVMQ